MRDSKLVYSAPPATLFGNIVTVATLLSLFSSILLSPFIVVAFGYFVYQLPLVAATMITLLLSTLWMGRNGPWKAFRDNAVFAHWRSYFSLRVIKETPLPEKRCLLAVFPHGVFPLGLLLCAGCADEMFPEHLPEASRLTGVASVFFQLPVLGAMLSWLGCVPANAGTVRAALQKGLCCVLPEGIAGVFLTSRRQELVYLSRRRGFIKLAMQEKSAIVPTYVFGQSHLLDVLPGAGSYLESLSRRLRVSLMFFFGRYYFPLPRAIPLTVVLGAPIEYEPTVDPTPEQVDAVHKTFCRELVALFDRHKDAFGWGDKNLEIV